MAKTTMVNVVGKDKNNKELIIETNLTEAQAFKFCENCNWIYDNRYSLEIRPIEK